MSIPLPRRVVTASSAAGRRLFDPASRRVARYRLAWLRRAAAAGTLTLAMLQGAPDAQAQVASDRVGCEVQVNTETSGSQSSPSAAMDADGDYVIAWQSFGQGIYAQRYAADGTPQGGEFRVNTFTGVNQFDPSVAMDADGDFVVAWASRQDGDSYGVYAQRYAADGTPQGSEFQVNTYTTDRQENPSVAMDADGDFVIAWQSGIFNGSGQDGSYEGIIARRYNAAGEAQGSEFQVNTYTTNRQRTPSVAMDADGDFVIAWTSGYYSGIAQDGDIGQDGDSFGVYAQRYAADGTPQGTEFQVNTFTGGGQARSSVAMDADGDFVIAWRSGTFSGSPQDGDSYGVFAQRYATDGTPQGSEFQVNTYTTSVQTLPVVAMDADGDFIVAWQSLGQDGSDQGVFAQRYLANGTAQGAETPVNTFTTGVQTSPVVAMDNTGDFVIAWASQLLSGGRQGGGSSAPYTPSSPVLGVAQEPCLPLGDDGEFYGVFAQRYGTDDAPPPTAFDLALTTEVVYTGPGSGTVTATMTNTGDVAADLVRVKRTQQRDVTVAEKQIVVGPLAPGEAGSVVFTFTDAEEGATIKLRGQDLTVQGGEDDFTNNLVTLTLDPPDLIVLLTPDDVAPITVPSTGGSVWFTGTASNTTASPLEQETWVLLQGPGDDAGQLFGPQTVRLGAGQTVDRRFEAIVGPGDAAGTYTVIARLGTFPDGIDAEDRFTFEKQGGPMVAGPTNIPSLYAPSVGGPIWGVTDNAEWARMLAADSARKAALAEEEAALAEAAESEPLPEVFALVEPYPNPMSGLSSVRFELPEEAEVTVTLYDVLGRTVAVLAQGTFEAGRHEAVLDGRTLASGAYVVRFEAGAHTLAKPVTVIR